jgi:aminoglycoside 6'-N-acetyltransferase I
MKTREAQSSDLEAWVRLRHALWPHSALDALGDEARSILSSPHEVCFLVIHPSQGAVGFAEAALYQSPNGPYCHVEGWYVMPDFRGRGHGKTLVECIEQWSLHRSICLLTSDTDANYPLSPDAHARAGFKKIHELVIFVKDLHHSPQGGR